MYQLQSKRNSQNCREYDYCKLMPSLPVYVRMIPDYFSCFLNKQNVAAGEAECLSIAPFQIDAS